jgi:Plasma-membrane choline transporter
MFSEYASRFLAQSQSRISFAPTEERRPGQETRRQNPSAWRSSASRANVRRFGNPYQPSASQASGFPFASRLGRQDAPLFYSATDEFREENDEEEHEREIADYYALQKSRRHLGGSDLKESSETGEESNASLDANLEYSNQQQSRAGGIRSSWRGGVTSGRGRGLSASKLPKPREDDDDDRLAQSTRSGKGRMVDVGLEDTLRSELDDDPPDDLMEDPPSIQQLRKPPRDPEDLDESAYMPEESDQDALIDQRRLDSVSEEGSVPEMVGLPTNTPPRHDAFFGHIYLLALGAMFTTWFLVFLHTAPPGTKQPLGDTIYTTLHGSFNLLATYTVVSIFIALLWLAALRQYVRYLVYSILIAVPVILYSFSLYPFVSSYKGSWKGNSLQDKIMRWTSLVPAILATLWILAVIRGRLAMQKAIAILEFATRVLAANPGLLVVGLSVLASIIGFTWLWLSMFTRVFLGGHLMTTGTFGRFIIDASTWWLGLYFILVYLWSIAQIFGIQRSATSATVSQWYFHRLAVPAPTSQTIVKAALTHAATTLFGTISLSTALSLMVRLPLLLLPKRLTMLLGVAMYSLIPTPVAILINPLTLTYASIHSQPLAISSRGLMQMHFLAPSDATTSLHPNTFKNQRASDGWSSDASPLLPYRLAKLLLHATRFIMSFALGYGGWVSTARSLKLAGAGVRGSLYAYIVGLIAGAIGWGILGAMEGILACILDALVVCWGSEVGSSGRGEVRYCREAGWLFREETDPREGQVSLA